MLKQSYLALWTKESVPFFKQLPYFLQRLKGAVKNEVLNFVSSQLQNYCNYTAVPFI